MTEGSVSTKLPELGEGEPVRKPLRSWTLSERVQEFERRVLIAILRRTKGHMAQAARIAGRNRSEFYRLLERHDLKPATFRDV